VRPKTEGKKGEAPASSSNLPLLSRAELRLHLGGGEKRKKKNAVKKTAGADGVKRGVLHRTLRGVSGQSSSTFTRGH